jgi:hypothetical protein
MGERRFNPAAFVYHETEILFWLRLTTGFGIKAEIRRAFVVNKRSWFIYIKQALCRPSKKKKQSSSFHIRNEVLSTRGNGVCPDQGIRQELRSILLKSVSMSHLKIRKISATTQFFFHAFDPTKNAIIKFTWTYGINNKIRVMKGYKTGDYQNRF